MEKAHVVVKTIRTVLDARMTAHRKVDRPLHSEERSTGDRENRCQLPSFLPMPNTVHLE
jgi:hypothetical protein